jgi:hypothetical protein
MCACRRRLASFSGAITTCSLIACSRFPHNGHVYVAGFWLCARRTAHHSTIAAAPSSLGFIAVMCPARESENRPFVPAEFVPPRRLETPHFRLEPLGPEHNEPDYEAWSTSIEHIRATPGWQGGSWPRELTLTENLADLERHANDFANRTGFTYTVIDPDGDVVGCVYIYPAADQAHDAQVSSWVRASRGELDATLWVAVRAWLSAEWPFEAVDYADRQAP